jgi:hypothetical protein
VFPAEFLQELTLTVTSTGAERVAGFLLAVDLLSAMLVRRRPSR